jgi:hypothetical protein
VRGEDSLGNKAQEHRTDWRVKPFVTDLAPMTDSREPSI